MAKKAKQPLSDCLDESMLNPRARVLLEELSTELKLPKKVVMELARMLYQLNKDKR